MQTVCATNAVVQPTDAAACAACAASYLKMCAKCKALGNAAARYERLKRRNAERAYYAVMLFVFRAVATFGVLCGWGIQSISSNGAGLVFGTILILGSLFTMSVAGGTYRRELAELDGEDANDLANARNDIECMARASGQR